MTLTVFISLQLLLIAGCVTPGPNNALLSSSGMRFGYRATMPHAWGVMIGHAVMEFMVAAGLGAIYLSFPILNNILTIVAILLLCYLAYKIATAPVDKFAESAKQAKPWGFWQAFVFQWINPKAWLIAIGVSGQYASGEHPLIAATFIGIATLLAGVISTQTWTIFGVAMARILNTPLKRRIFNISMALLIIASIFMLIGHK